MPKDLSQDYLQRIHKAQDHIQAKLAEPLRLEDIAREACFSPFHFHRIYAAFTGETLYQFILRIRLERAASLILSGQSRSLTELSLDCGFSSPAVFARAFKKAFGMSASEYRKNGKAGSKQGKAEPSQMGHLGVNNPPSRRTTMPQLMPKHAEVRALPQRRFAYLRHVGPYAGDHELFGRLWGRFMAWAGPRGLVGPQNEFLTFYHDDPSVTEPAKLRLSLGVTVPDGFQVDGGMGLMEIPAGRVACLFYDIDPRQYGEAWAGACHWLAAQGLEMDERLCYEKCMNDPAKDPQGRHHVEICIPVR